MMRVGFSALCAILGWVSGAAAAFSEPSSSVKDFEQRWFVGDTIHIAWDKGWNWGVGTQPKVADLFIAWFDDSIDNPFWKVLQTNIPTNVSGNYDWKIDLEDTTIDRSTQYHFRLIEHAGTPTYSLKVARLPSRGFNIYPQNNATTSSIASATSSTAPPTATPDESNGSTPKPTQKKKKKHIGAIAGGVIAGLVVIALLCVVALILLKRAHKKKAAAEPMANEAVEAPTARYTDEAKVQSQYASPPAELGDVTRHEIDGAARAPTPTLAAELPASIPKTRP